MLPLEGREVVYTVMSQEFNILFFLCPDLMIYIIFWFLVQRLASVAFLESMQKLAETTDKSNKIKEQ